MRLPLFFFAISLALLSLQQDVSLSADSYSLKCGEATTLRWSAGSSDRVFIVGLGNVPATGNQSVNPSKTTTYDLLAEGPKGLRSKKITIAVAGCQRGDNDYPDDERYETQLTADREAPSTVDFLAHIQDVLQDKLGFTVKSYAASEGVYVFKTKVWERQASTPEDNQNRIGARRVSFLVEIRSRQPGKLVYTIKTFTQKKKVLKETWSDENDANVRRAEANKVRQLIG